MKNFLTRRFLFFAVMMTMFLSTVTAQSGYPYTFPTILGDSLTNTDTVFKKISVSGAFTHLSVQASVKKGTGTLDGKLYLYTSVALNHYELTDSASWTTLPTLAATLTGSTNSYTATAQIFKSAPPGTSYIVAVTQGGSLTASPVKVSYTLRK